LLLDLPDGMYLLCLLKNGLKVRKCTKSFVKRLQEDNELNTILQGTDGLWVMRKSAGVNQNGGLGIERRTHGDITTIDVDKAWICKRLRSFERAAGKERSLILMGWSLRKGRSARGDGFPRYGQRMRCCWRTSVIAGSVRPG
jgi:hypothetical protein